MEIGAVGPCGFAPKFWASEIANFGQLPTPYSVMHFGEDLEALGFISFPVI